MLASSPPVREESSYYQGYLDLQDLYAPDDKIEKILISPADEHAVNRAKHISISSVKSGVGETQQRAKNSVLEIGSFLSKISMAIMSVVNGGVALWKSSRAFICGDVCIESKITKPVNSSPSVNNHVDGWDDDNPYAYLGSEFSMNMPVIPVYGNSKPV